MAKKQRRPIFTRGYSESRERVSKSAMFSRSCFNCDSYYQAVGDKEEVCQNTNVLRFDMVFDNNNMYCVYWTQSKRTKGETTLFKKKLGRSVLD